MSQTFPDKETSMSEEKDCSSVAGVQAAPDGATETQHSSGKDEFCARFKAKMLAVAGPTFADGDSVAEYADQAAPTYWDDPDQRAEGPEECALTDISYWEDD